MKSGLGVGEKQCWNHRSAVLSVQWSTWVYAILLLAAYHTWGLCGGPAQNVGLLPPCGAVIALLSGVNLNFRPFGHQLATTGGKKRPGWPVYPTLFMLPLESEAGRALFSLPASLFLPRLSLQRAKVQG
jgi:hypothetical protein